MLVEPVRDLRAIESEWEDLWTVVPDASPFQHPAWQVPWWEIFGSGELLSLAVRSEGRLVGLMTAFLHPWEGRNQITFVGNGVSDRLDVLVEPDLEEDAMAALLEHLAHESPRWDLCDLQDLCGHSPLLRAAIPAPLQADIEPQYTCSAIPLPGSVDEFQAGLPHGLKRNLRRYRARLDELGPVTLETATRAEFPVFLDALFALHRARWTMKDDKGMLHGAAMETFHCRAARNLEARGVVRLHGLRLNGVLIAIVYAFVRGKRAYSYLGGFDPLLAKFSLGSLIMHYTIEQAILEGVTEFDFLRGEESYKFDWGAQTYVSSRLRLRHA